MCETCFAEYQHLQIHASPPELVRLGILRHPQTPTIPSIAKKAVIKRMLDTYFTTIGACVRRMLHEMSNASSTEKESTFVALGQ